MHYNNNDVMLLMIAPVNDNYIIDTHYPNDDYIDHNDADAFTIIIMTFCTYFSLKSTLPNYVIMIFLFL